MANIKEYSIKINGITETVNAVESLNKELSTLEARIKALEGKNLSVKSSGGGSSSSLSEEEKIQKQIEQIDAKRVTYSKEIYQSYLAAKDVLKETVKDQNAIAASERLQAKTYSNTMMGMKQELADIKSAMQTVDLGDTGVLDKMVQRANELNSKLKEIEQSYGQFGRNVGNYSSAFDGFQKVSVSINGVTREFDNARQASATLKKELQGLEIAGSGNTEVAKELRSEYYKLISAMDDASKSSKAMDEAMDYMQSFTAMASVGQGLKGFFGLDESEIQRSIQKLVSLQNVLNGIETLRKQMETAEGIGQLLTKGSGNIDKMVAGLTGAKVAADGLTMGSKAATLAVRGLSAALKGIGIGLVLEAINLLVQGIEWTVGKITSWVKGDADLIKEEKQLESQLEYVNRKLEERNAELSKQYYQGLITQEEYFRGQLQETTNAINEQIKALKEKASLEGGDFSNNINNGITGEISMSVGGGTTIVNDLNELTKLWKFYSDAVLESKDAMSKLNDETGTVSSFFRSFIYTLDDTKDDLVEIGQVAIGEFLQKYQHAMQTMQTDTKAGERELAELKKMMDDNEMLRSIFMNLDQYIPVEGFRKRVQQIIDLIRGVKTEMGDLESRTVQQVLRSEQLKIDAMADGAAKRQAQRDLDKKKELADATLTAQDKENIEKKYQQRKLREEKAANQKSQNETRKNNREILEAERDLANLRISNMKEGLNKVLKQLEEERKARLRKVEADGRLIAERQAEINQLYDKKILDAKEEWAKKVEKTYKDLWDKIYAYSLETQRKLTENTTKTFETASKNIEYGRGVLMPQEAASYGIQGTNQMSKDTQKELDVEKNGNKDLIKVYNSRQGIIEQYWKSRTDLTLKYAKENKDNELEIERQSYEAELRESKTHYDEQLELIKENNKKGLISDEEFYDLSERLLKEWTSRDEELRKGHEQNTLQIYQKTVDEIRSLNGENYREQLQELRDFQTAISNLESKQPVYNAWGITDFKKTNENNEKLLESYKKLADEILRIKKELQTKLEANEISFDDFQNANRELDAFADNVGQKMDEVKAKLSIGNQIAQFIQDTEKYLQAGMQSFNTIMNEIWNAQDIQFEKEQELLDKMNEELDNKLQEQQEIVDKHKQAIDSIEDELSSARGERRQHLIDQINAEMAAQREAQKQEQKIQKEKEAAQKKQDELEKKRKKAQYKRDLLQAIVNGAMAVTMAAVNSWPIPAIPMMALAGATTAAQIAIMASNKPYAKGGLLEGPSHKQGGIPVGNTGIEVEGKEYVVRKKSTTPNIQLLDYINKSERKLNLDDFINFYSSGNLKKNISSISPRTKFADGGTIPTISNNYTFDDRLLTAFEDYSNRPVVVSVVDINNRQAAVKNVQVLAGIQ